MYVYWNPACETFQEEPRDISGAEITLSVTVCTYNGLARKPSPAVVLQGETLIKNTDYTVSYSNNINAGKAKVIIKGKGNYTGTCSTVFTINVRSITPKLTLSEKTFLYDGTKKTPSVTVMYKDTVLEEGTDYTISYSNNKKVGTASVNVILQGNYEGILRENCQKV